MRFDFIHDYFVIRDLFSFFLCIFNRLFLAKTCRRSIGMPFLLFKLFMFLKFFELLIGIEASADVLFWNRWFWMNLSFERVGWEIFL